PIYRLALEIDEVNVALGDQNLAKMQIPMNSDHQRTGGELYDAIDLTFDARAIRLQGCKKFPCRRVQLILIPCAGSIRGGQHGAYRLPPFTCGGCIDRNRLEGGIVARLGQHTMHLRQPPSYHARNGLVGCQLFREVLAALAGERCALQTALEKLLAPGPGITLVMSASVH